LGSTQNDGTDYGFIEPVVAPRQAAKTQLNPAGDHLRRGGR
jgi:hypothetical protein